MKKESRKNLSLPIFLALLIFTGQFLPTQIWAADVFLFSANQEFLGDDIVVSLGLDTGSEKINTVAGSLSYDHSYLELVSVSNANSPISLWVEAPTLEIPGIVSFSGVIPGGFSGQGKILSLIFKTKVGERDVVDAVKIKTIEILRNDGLGTAVETNIISPDQDLIKMLNISSSVDDNAPEVFKPILRREDPLFDGQSYLLFNTTDKGSGIDKYFVLESERSLNLKDQEALTRVTWSEAKSPYLLQNQNIAKHIYVKVIDRAGNSLIVELEGEKKFYRFWWFWVIIIIALIGVCFWWKRKFL